MNKWYQTETLASTFSLVAKEFAHRIALVHDGRDFTYSELNLLSDILAARLMTAGVQAGDLVGFAARSDPLAILAILATQKLGAGYVPLPDYYPPERLRMIAGDAKLRVIIGELPALDDSLLTQVDFDWRQDAGGTVQLEPPPHDPEAVAYVMYTSGSTGTPKGVVIPQRAVLRLVRGQDFMSLSPDERILQASPISFDAATLEIWGALLNGGTLVLPETEVKSLRGLGEMIARHRITSLWLTAGLFHAMADERPGDFAPLRQLLTGGDVVSPARVAQVMAACPELTVINGYGPTENTTFTCCHHISRAEAEAGAPLPIGRAISGTEIYVLNDALHPVAPGEPGELCVAGAGLAKGYLGRDDLTAEKFVPAPWNRALTLYRTGDLVRWGESGVLHYLGRNDTQVKVRGYRIELAELEAAAEAFPGIRQAVAVARPGLTDAADKTLVLWLVADEEPDPAALRAHLAGRLPDYAVPSRFARLDHLPLNDNGKVDRRALLSWPLPQAQAPMPKQASAAAEDDAEAIEEMIASTLGAALGVDAAGLDHSANFFDLGASSLHVARVHERLQSGLDRAFPITDFFLHSSISNMARHLSGCMADQARHIPHETDAIKPGAEIGTGLIAIVGLAGRFPGAPDIATFWDGLVNGREMISHFSAQELDVDLSSGQADGHFVNARGVMPDADKFDAQHFKIPPREAERMDPQHRILLELAQTALDDAGYDPDRFSGKIGIFAGSSQNSYLLNNLLSAPGSSRKFAASYPLDDFATLFGNDKDFIATRIAYKLNLRGPAATVLCACSTSLVAVAQGCDALRRGAADLVLAGGVSVTFPSRRNYKYLPDGMASADGHCRTFDAEATGTVFGDGAGLVALRRLEDAVKAGDTILAVIRGWSINNDGSEKAGYAAPSIRAQAEVIRDAQAAAGVTPREIGYVEAHGTATPLGDPIEFAALHEAFSSGTDERGFCALGSVKTNVGHLDIAAGVTGLIKAVLVLKNEVIPPLLHYKAPNPRINFTSSAFYPAAALTPWPRAEAPRIAGVSAFGVGGTNIHMIVEEAPAFAAAPRSVQPGLRVFPVSASSAEAVAAAVTSLGQWAGSHPDADPDAVVATLRDGRRALPVRAVLVAEDMAELAERAATFTAKPIAVTRREAVAFLFPGQGAQHVGMARDLFAAEPVFREALSLCAKLLEPELGLDLLSVIHAPEAEREAMTARLKDTALAQPAIFSICYALAKQWEHWGIRPDVMVGHSIGEFAAATLAGVFDLQDTLRLIALRGRLMADLPGGVMVSVRAAEDDLLPWLGAGLDLAAVNGAKACVLAGSEEAAAAILPQMEAARIVTSRLHTSHAFHSHMMDPALAPFRDAVAKLTLRAAEIPIISTVTGDWLTESEAVDPDYWASHMRRSVRFYDAVQVLWAEGRHIFLEAGPGRTMSVLAGQNPDRKKTQPTLASLPHAQAEDTNSHRAMLEAFGGLWANGYPVDWSRIDKLGQPPRRAGGLPTYPFQRKRFWVDPVETPLVPSPGPQPTEAATEDTSVTADAPRISAADALREMLSELSGVKPSEMDGDATFLQLGFDSLLLTQATRELTERFSVSVTLRQLIDGFSTIDALAAHVEMHGNLRGAPPADRTPLAEMTRIEGIAKGAAQAEPAPTSAPMTRIAREVEEITPAQRAHIDRLVARYTAKTAKSKALTTRYRQFHADPRTASGFNRLWKEIVYQIVTVKSKGSRLIDVDGAEYIDILNGFGPGFLGHSPDLVVKAVEDQLHAGFEVGPQSLAAMEAAELFCEVTGNDRASFVCTGSEAVYAAMRLARTVTSRDRIVMFARDYHGNFDEVLVRGIDGNDGPRTLPLAPGIPRDAVKNVTVLPYGTAESLDWIRRNAGSLAAVIVEPVQSRRPEFRPRDFIREVRRITEKSGSLFIFDEVVTGFRFGPRGAQAYYGVKADLVTYGKVVGGGMPLGVVSGQSRFMDTFDGGMWAYGDDSFPTAPVTFFAGTFVRHPLVMASLKAMLTFFKSQPDFFWKTVNCKGDRVAGTLDKWFADNDMPFQFPNCGSLMYLRIGEDQKFGPLLGAHLRDRGVFMLEGFPSYMTAAHDDADIDHIIAAMQDSALEMRADGLLTGREAVAYEGPVIHHAPARLSLPGGEAAVAAAMVAPLGPLSVPTTEAQREILTAILVTPEVAAAYNESVTLKLKGTVDRAALVAAIQSVFRRHDALRSTFSADGMLMHIHPDLNVEVPILDLTGKDAEAQDTALQALLVQHVTKTFDLESGPFVRAHLVALAQGSTHLVITAHHIVCDGWSIDVIMKDIGKVYSALVEGRSPDLETAQSIIDYAQAEAEWARSPEAKESQDFWLNTFADGIPVLDLPADHPRAAVRGVRGGRIDRPLPLTLTESLRELAREQGATFVNLLLAAYSLYIARAGSTSDVVIGLPTAGQAARDMAGVVGHCVSVLPLRSRIDWNSGFDGYLSAMRQCLLNALDHQNYTYGELVRDLHLPRDPSRPTLVPVVFNFDKGIDLSDMSFGDTQTEFVTNPRRYENFDLYLNVTDAGRDVLMEWSFNSDLFDRETVTRFAENFERLLGAIVDAPDGLGAALSSFFRPRKDKLTVGASVGQAVLGPQTITEAFRKVAAEMPGNCALRFGTQDMDYATLDRASDALAALLVAEGVVPGDLVGLSSHRALELPVAMLGILKAGAGYVPFDTSLPPDRLEFMARDTGIRVLLGACAPVSAMGIRTFAFSEFPTPGAPAPEARVSGSSIAYVMFTSGTTGTPKGVVVPQQGVVRLVCGQDYMSLGPSERILQASPVGFDAATLEIWGALLNGGTLVLPDAPTGSLHDLGEMIARHKITSLWLTAGLFHAMADENPGYFASLRQLLTGGDVVSPARVAQVMAACPELTVINGYGPTENTTFTCCHRISNSEVEAGAALPIGRAISGTQVYILDASLNPVGFGETGELCIAGRGLALGYWNRPELTAEKFITAPWDPNLRLYRSGDLAMDPGDGVLRFYGRMDTQVKIRGFRVELSEIEAALESHPAVRQTVVIAAVPEGQADKILVSYFIPDGEAPSPVDLAAHVKSRLPDFSRPSFYVKVDEIPLNTNGKVDRRRLPPFATADGIEGAEEPETVNERRLAAIWAQVLGHGGISAQSNFFMLGGHSLLAVRLFDRIRKEFGVDLPIATLFQNQTLRDLAALLPDPEAAANVSMPKIAKNEAPEADWDTSTIIHPGPKGGTNMPLVIAGGVGGNVNNLFELGCAIGATRPVIGFQTRGVQGHTPRASIEEMAAEHIRYMRQHQPQGPYLLAGYSGGAFTALEMARQLETAGETVERLFVFDAMAPDFAVDFLPDIPVTLGMRARYEWKTLREGGLGYFWSRASSVLSRQIEGEFLLPILRRTSLSHYRYRVMETAWRAAARVYRGGHLSGPITLLKSRPVQLRDILAHDRDPSYGWKDICEAEGQLEMIMVPGDHKSMLKGENTQHLADLIEGSLDRGRRSEL